MTTHEHATQLAFPVASLSSFWAQGGQLGADWQDKTVDIEPAHRAELMPMEQWLRLTDEQQQAIVDDYTDHHRDRIINYGRSPKRLKECSRGHLLTEGNTYRTQCRTCRAESRARASARAKAMKEAA